MSMNWGTNERARERILLYGLQGCGKSTAVLSIAKLVPDRTIHVLDTEGDVYDRLLVGSDITNIKSHGVLPDDWDSQIAAAKEISEEIGEDDWFVIDSISPTWPAVTSWYVDRVFDQNVEDYFLAAREAAKGGNPLDGWKDYSVINKQYGAFYNLMLRASMSKRCHLLWTAEAAEIRDDAPRDKQLLYRGIGYEPSGQKRIGYVPHTIIWLRQDRGSWGWQTVKDQGVRGGVEGELTDFGRQYLGGVAGWRPMASNHQA